MSEMVEKLDKIRTNERKSKKMANGNQNNRVEKILEAIKTIGGVFAVFGVVIGATNYIGTNFERHSNEIRNLQDDFKEIEKGYADISDKIDILTELAENNNEKIIELASLDNGETPYNIMFKDIYQVRTEEVKNEFYLVAPTWEEGNIIASDYSGDTIYNPEDLYNKPIITSYLDGDNEVYFYGKFNDDNQWNGRCILNTYNNNKLISIFEGVYDNGELYSYKTVIEKRDDEVEGKYFWLINDRINQGEYNSGKTWKITKSDEYVKEFTLDNVKEKQIITVDRFLDSKNEKLLGYYKGNTSNGLYNDNTQNAYLIKYNDDGKLIYLYKGKMVDGYPDDDTGEAWSVGWGYADDGYYYYKGKFSQGEHGKAPKNWKPMTSDEIEEKFGSEDFDYPLTGLVEDVL